jgi:hypothetical protein
MAHAGDALGLHEAVVQRAKGMHVSSMFLLLGQFISNIIPFGVKRAICWIS